jgi:ABC-type amino acid transport substrate-binding protein
LDWRRQVIQFSNPTFPTGVWLIARADSSIKPIEPSGDVETDIERVKSLLAGRSVLTMEGTCLDPSLYDLASTRAEIRLYTASENLNEIAPAVINGAAEATLLDVPDALVALQTWPGDIKIIGPISSRQLMGAAVAKSSPELLAAFNRFFQDLRTSGTYDELVKKYYPSVYLYLGDFFKSEKGEQ